WSLEGITWATAVMATPANVEALGEAVVAHPELEDASASDLVLVARGRDDDAVARALAAGSDALFASRRTSTAAAEPHRDPALMSAVRGLAGANLAIVSVPGPYAALEAHKALGAGLDVLLFSDNVSVVDEVELKQHAIEAGRLLMGPGAGTAVLAGCGLG